MRKSKLFLCIGFLLIIIAIIFVIFALCHPEMSFIGGNAIAYPVYVLYLIITVIMFVLAKKDKK